MSQQSEQTGPRGIRIYRAADAPEVHECGFSGANDFTNAPELEARLPEVVATMLGEEGVHGRVLAFQTPEEGGYSLLYLHFKPHFPLFRHTHEMDCMYVIISGTAVLGNQELHAGDSFFVPAYAPYMYSAGPEGVEVLEIRKDVPGFSIIYLENPPSRVDDAKAAIEANRARWQDVSRAPWLEQNPSFV